MTARASLTSLDNVLAERGLKGSGMEGVGVGSVVNNAADTIDAHTNRQLTEDLDYAGHIDDRNFEANNDAMMQQRALAAQQQASLLGLMRSGGGAY